MKTLSIKAVIITDGDNYIIHGSNSETPQAMFKALAPIWEYNPATETAHYVEIPVNVPDFEDVASAEYINPVLDRG